MWHNLGELFYVIGDKIVSFGTHSKHDDQKEILDPDRVFDKPITDDLVPVESPESLREMTKQDICNLSAERFGVGLNIRSTKPELISAYLTRQLESLVERENEHADNST
jgi:hypothetical protein